MNGEATSNAFTACQKVEQERRMKATGYESFRDMLGHILAWWEEGMVVIRAVAEGREFERKKYDYDVFNAEAVAKYRDWGEPEFMVHFEKSRRNMGSVLKSMDEAAFENRRVRSWVNGIFIHHAREHLVVLSKFLTIDLLENEWAEYVGNFNHLDEEEQTDFLTKQGFASLHDLLAHIIGWWEEGARVITGILATPGFEWQVQDVDAFNDELTKKSASWSGVTCPGPACVRERG